jgi:hypothetical protein
MLSGSGNYADEPDLKSGFAACLSGAVVIALPPILVRLGIGEFWIFIGSTFASTVLVATILPIAMRAIQTPKGVKRAITTTFTALMLLFMTIPVLLPDEFPLAKLLSLVGVLREATVAILPLILLGANFLAPSLRTQDPSSAWRQYLWIPRGTRHGLTLFFGIWGAAVLDLIFLAITSPTEGFFLELGAADVYSWGATTLCWLPLAWNGTIAYARHLRADHETKALSRFTGFHAQRFYRRYYEESTTWAATTGMRTTNFFIDHDPYDEATSNLPATIAHIRGEEILSCVKKLLDNRLLYHRALGNQIQGVIDPESVYRPCLEVMTLFACIYLDAAPLVERRLRGLGALLPILDPDLAKLVTAERIRESLGKINWLFQFEYDWMDQQIVTTEHGTHYAVTTTTAKSSTKHRVLSYLREKHRLGNFILMGERARERILMEAPYLAHVIEAWPISISEKEDIIIFLIKFEELIPRLQRFYGLDEARQVLKDFDPSPESRQFINMSELQLSQTKVLADVAPLIDGLRQFPWNGFAEKDLALRFVVTCFEQASRLGEGLAQQTAATSQLQSRFLRVLEHIGYPSQILHVAHLNKMRLRDAKRLAEVARNKEDERFEEAWLFLASMEAGRYSPEDLAHLLGVILTTLSDKTLRKQPMVRAKICEAFFNVAHLVSSVETALLTKGINKMGVFLVDIAAEPALMNFYLDGKLFLEEQLKENLPLSHGTTEKLARYFSFLFNKLGPDSPQIVSLGSRWKSLMAQIQLSA